MRFVCLFALLLAGCADAADDPVPDAPAPPMARPEAPAVDPEALGGDLPVYAERLLSNPYVEVSRFALPPGRAVALRTGKNWVAYALSDAELRVDGEPETWAAGSAVLYTEPARIENVGADSARVLFLERWANPLPDRALPGQDPDLRFPAELTRLNEIDNEALEVLVADDRVVVARVTLAPGTALPTHSAFSRVVYALNDYTVERYNSEGFAGTTADGVVARRAGAIAWDSALNYGARNVGEAPSETLLVAYYD
ncbi:hypothetical protein [Rubrivirga sp. IMCC45206]|uniref:hypothetical protein n=1 Tax=Rubrivirga sp. IMCC45206 TaxID=3391614 RepID=UPI0039900354